MKIKTELKDTLQVWKYKQNKLWIWGCPIDKVGYEKDALIIGHETACKQTLIDCALDIELIGD